MGRPRLLPESHGQNLALTVLYAPCSLDTGTDFLSSGRPSLVIQIRQLWRQEGRETQRSQRSPKLRRIQDVDSSEDSLFTAKFIASGKFQHVRLMLTCLQSEDLVRLSSGFQKSQTSTFAANVNLPNVNLPEEGVFGTPVVWRPNFLKCQPSRQILTCLQRKD